MAIMRSIMTHYMFHRRSTGMVGGVQQFKAPDTLRKRTREPVSSMCIMIFATLLEEKAANLGLLVLAEPTLVVSLISKQE